MPTKLRGKTSLEIAIIVGIVLVIAVAVGWYLYTTFIASTTGQPRLNVVSATLYASSDRGTLKLNVTNPGPVDVQITQIEVAGKVKDVNKIIKIGKSTGITVTFNGKFTPGTTLTGRVILSSGHSFPFTAIVRPNATVNPPQS